MSEYALDPSSGNPSLIGTVLTFPSNAETSFIVTPDGRFLYLTNSQRTFRQESGTVQPYAIDSSSGALTAIGTATPVVANGGGMAADPTGNYLYLISNLNWDAASNTIQALNVDPGTGSLGTIGSILQTAGPPTEVLCDPSGQFVFMQMSVESSSLSISAVLTTFSISTSPGTAGQLMSSGPSQPAASQEGGPIAIVE